MKTFFQRLFSGLASPQHDGGLFAGMRYFYGSWQEVLAEAKRQSKPVFVDFYTTGFYPREQIAKEASLDPALARKFNAHFVNYGVDANKGEGLEIAKRYRMNTSPVPTSLFVLWDGSLLHRASGYEGLTGLLNEADKALELTNQPNPLMTLEQDYVMGKHDPAFLAAYLLERTRAGMPNHDALLTYLALLPETDWTTDETIRLIVGNLTAYYPAPINALLQKLRQLSDLPDQSGKSLQRQIGDCIRQLIRIRFHQAIADRDEQQLAAVIADNEQFLRADRGDTLTKQEADNMTNGYRRRFYAETKNIDKYRPLAEAEAWRLMTISMDAVREKDTMSYQLFLERKKKLDARAEWPDYGKFAKAMSTFESHDMASKLNRLVSYYFENMTNPDDLEQALTWSARSLEFDPCPGYLNLHARLLIKLGRTKEADVVLENLSAQQTPGTYITHVVTKRPEDYEW